MLPSWFTRLRDVKAASIDNEQNKLLLHAASLATKRRDQDSASFAKSRSLQRASSEAKGKRVPADITSTCDDSHPSINDEVSSLGSRNLQIISELGKDDAITLLVHVCAKLDPWDDGLVTVSSCKKTSASISCKELKALVQNGHVVSDNDTEDFALTSETRSSFGSETSFAESSISCKSGCEEKENQEEKNWHEKSACNKSSGGQVTSTGWSDKEQTVRMWIRDTWKGRGSVPFSYLTVRRRKNVRSKNRVTNIFDQISTTRDSKKTSEARRYVLENEEENVIETSFLSSKSEKKHWTVFGVRHNRENADTLDGNGSGKSSTVGDANRKRLFKHSDAHGCTSSSLVNASGIDPLPQNVWPGKICQQNSTTETQSAVVTSSTRCTPPEATAEEKGEVVWRRRRQRGASISAVLPPDLQGVVGDSLALVKMSDDPYEDFKQSICEMIMEKDLEGSLDVEELLYCYLSLNAPEHHGLIKEVFSDVWSEALMS